MNCSIFSKNKNEGFTLTELIVVMAIATIITTALVIQQSKWNDQLAVNTQTYEMALMIRQAQIYSLGVREHTTSTGDKFNIGYGVYVDISNTNRYSFFADKNKNLKMDAGEEIEVKMFTRGVAIEKMCGFNSSGTERCYPQNGIRKVAVSFYRPEPGAIIRFFNEADNPDTSIGPPTIVYLLSPKGKESTIRVEANGQVSVTQ